MKKDIGKKIKVRLSLFFLWLPFGLYFLLKDKSIKHRGWIGTIYFCLWAGFGFPFIGYMLLNMDYTTGFACYLLLGGFLLILYHFVCLLPDFIRNKKNKVEDFENENIEVKTPMPNTQLFCSNPETLVPPKKRNENEYKFYGAGHSSNNSQPIYSEKNHYSYQKAQVLTEREKNFYETIRLIAEKHNLNVSAKMRLADIVNVSDKIQKQSSLWHSKFGKISQKHIDFALQDKTNLEIKLLIEIDDYTHQRTDRIERDKFVDSVCEQVNIPILHLYDVIGLEDKIVNLLHSEKTKQEM